MPRASARPIDDRPTHDRRPTRYHHARPLAAVRFGIVRAEPAARSHDVDPADTRHMDAAYRWLEAEVGFRPTFLAVGETAADRWLTGYQNQFRRVLGWSVTTGTIRRRRGEFPDDVMFSWVSNPPGAVLMDFDLWHVVLNSVAVDSAGRFCVTEIGARDRRGIFKSSWAPHRWRHKARREPGSVQAVVPELDLRTADEIWCRNRTTRARLTALGFEPDRITVRRVRI